MPWLLMPNHTSPSAHSIIALRAAQETGVGQAVARGHHVPRALHGLCGHMAVSTGCVAVFGSIPPGAGSGRGATIGPVNEQCPAARDLTGRARRRVRRHTATY